MPQKIITHKKMLLVEGKDDEQFFRCMLKRGNLRDEVGYFDYEGSNFSSRLKLMCLESEFSSLTHLCIVADADKSERSRFQSITYQLKQQSLPVPDGVGEVASDNESGLNVSVVILPGEGRKGALEDICFESVSDHPYVDCVNRYLECVNNADTTEIDSTTCGPPSNESKAKMFAFLSAMKTPLNRLGHAAKKGVFDFESEKLSQLKLRLERAFA